MKPVIGITPLFDAVENENFLKPYCQLLIENGADPFPLPETTDRSIWDQALEKCDGFLFSGGLDLDPAFYHEKKSAFCGEINAQRDEMERYAMQQVLDKDLPMFCICRGIQLLNVINGGTLYQDIPTEFQTKIHHQMDKPPYGRKQHEVTLTKDSLLFDWLKKADLSVNSRHHQAIKELGQNLSVTAVSEDRLIEGIFMPKKKFAVGVQWHPESFGGQTTQNQKMMQAFLANCQ